MSRMSYRRGNVTRAARKRDRRLLTDLARRGVVYITARRPRAGGKRSGGPWMLRAVARLLEVGAIPAAVVNKVNLATGGIKELTLSTDPADLARRYAAGYHLRARWRP